MTVPVYLQGNVNFKEDVGVVDVQTIINSAVAQATALTPAWTNPLAGKIVSPPDAIGRQVTVQFNKIAATNLEAVITDSNGVSVTRRAQIAVAGSTVDYYFGQFHMILDWMNGATPEGMHVNILDLSPELQSAHNKWLFVQSSRTALDALDNAWDVNSGIVIRSAGTYAVLVLGMLRSYGNIVNQTIGSGMMCRSVAGSNIFVPFVVMGDTVATIFKIRGKCRQLLLCSTDFFTPSTEVSVPIDEATTGLFRVLNQANPAGAAMRCRLAVRKS